MDAEDGNALGREVVQNALGDLSVHVHQPDALVRAEGIFKVGVRSYCTRLTRRGQVAYFESKELQEELHGMKQLSFCIFLGAASLSGCVQTSAPEVTQYGNERLQIAAKVTPGLFDGELQLFINGQLVIKERSQAFGGSSQTFNGTWKGKQVVARATKVENFLSSYVMIDVFIGGQMVETLTV